MFLGSWMVRCQRVEWEWRLWLWVESAGRGDSHGGRLSVRGWCCLKKMKAGVLGREWFGGLWGKAGVVWSGVWRRGNWFGWILVFSSSFLADKVVRVEEVLRWFTVGMEFLGCGFSIGIKAGVVYLGGYQR